MNKKFLMFSVILNVLLIGALVFFGVTSSKTGPSNKTVVLDQKTLANMPAYVPKPIPLEMMSDTDKTLFNLSTSTAERIQVLQRDENGKITIYKIIKKDADILKEY